MSSRRDRVANLSTPPVSNSPSHARLILHSPQPSIPHPVVHNPPQGPRAPNAALGDLEHDVEDGLDPGPIPSNSHGQRRYTGAAPDIRASRVAQRRGSCSTMILNELNPRQAGDLTSQPPFP